MSRPVLAPLAVALSALLLAPVVAADPSSPLFVVEQQRSALVSRLAKQWSEAFAALPKERRLDHEQLSNALFALRADRLFAITFAGDAEAVEAVLADAKREAAKPRVAAKALGDVTADLTYTPINPCRILDTRATPAGPLAPNVARTFDGYSTNFATQGGAATGCGIPNGVAALAMNVYAVNPTNLGFIRVWPANGTEPDVSTVNYQVGITAIATGTLVPVDQANSNRFTAKSPATVDFIADVVGYFKPPGDTTSLDIKVAGQRVMRYEYDAISPKVIGGSPANGVAAGIRGASIAGGGVPLGGDPDFFSEGPNQVTGHYGSIGGGFANTAALFATVGGGGGNAASDGSATVSGGCLNTASGGGSTIGGGCLNTSSGVLPSTVGGGESNTASGSYSAISGGRLNTAGGYASAVVGGTQNIASGVHSFIGGGTLNAATGENDSVGGGNNNSATGAGSHIGGGQSNVTTGPNATICGGNWNAASGVASTACGGYSNSAIGAFSFVGGGMSNTASGAYSFAAGSYAKTQTADATPVVHDGAFVWAGAGSFAFHSTAHNEFAVRATGGVRFVTAIDGTGLPTWTCGVSSGAGGSWGCSSDRDAKTDLIPLDGVTTLERLAALPVYQWAAKDDPRRTPHAGPTAQDFMAAFGLGDNDKMIGFADAQGVALAAIKELNQRLEALRNERDRENERLRVAIELLLEHIAEARRPGGACDAPANDTH